jgi:biliverdin reductase
MEKLRVGMVGGTHGFGARRRKAFQADPRSQITAVCARTKADVEALAAEVGATAHTNWPDLIADPNVQAVSVATPNALHYEIAKAALDAGKHVLVEYPLCQTLEEFDDLARVAKRKGLVVHHALTTRGEPHHRKLKELMPRLGRIFHAHYRYFGGSHWYVDPALRGDLFVALHIHFLDQFEDIFGKTASITATAKVIQDAKCNIHSGTVLQEFADGANAFQEFGMGFGAKPSYLGWYIGENGWIGFEGRRDVHIVLNDGTDETIELADRDNIAKDTGNFIARILDGASSWISDEQSRRAIMLSVAASESARTGKKITLADR